MLQNEILVYEKLSKQNLNYIPRYNGVFDIPGKHCGWKINSELKEKLDFVIRDMKSVGVVHQDLRPENVLLTMEID